ASTTQYPSCLRAGEQVHGVLGEQVQHLGGHERTPASPYDSSSVTGGIRPAARFMTAGLARSAAGRRASRVRRSRPPAQRACLVDVRPGGVDAVRAGDHAEPAGYISGQNAVRSDGTVVGGTLAGQTRPALVNVQAALAAAGATLHDVVRWTIAIVDGQPPAEGLAAFGETWGNAGDAA